MAVFPVILCGGAGTRLWPASSGARPKQFMDLLGPLSLFQETVLRLRDLPDARAPTVIAGVAHVPELRRQLAQIGVEASLIVEPQGRDSGPAVVAVAAWIAGQDPAGVAVIVPSDHHVPDAAAFAAAVGAALAAARAGRIVTFGVKPTFPATAFGYIEPGDADGGAPGVHDVQRFIEKPDAAAAAALVAAGCLWNSGNFVFQAATLLSEVELHAPRIGAAVRAALTGGVRQGRDFELGPQFSSAEKISIDFAVMEKTARAAVLPIDFAWSDVGSWDAVLAASPRDERGNAIHGDAVVSDCDDCLVRAEPGARLVVVGLRDCVVVAQGGRTLVCHTASSQGLKAVVEDLPSSFRDAPAR